MAKQKSVEQMVAEEATKSLLPALPRERSLGMVDMVMIQISFGVATWMLIYGAYEGMAAPLPAALIAAVFGSSFPLLFHGFIGKMHARWGLDSSLLVRATFGPVGALIILPIFLFLTYLVWTSIPVVMFGRATQVALSYLNIGGFWGSPVTWGIFGLIFASVVLWKGATVLKWFFRFVTPTIVVLLVLITAKIIATMGWSQLWAMKPAGFDPDPVISYMIGSEITIGGGFSWVFCFGIYCRLARSERIAYYGPNIAWGPIFGLLTLPAIIGGLASGVTDPVYLLKDMGGGYVVAYVVFLFGANIFSAVCTMYIVSLAARTIWPKLKWGYAVLINALVAIAVVYPAAYDGFGKFVTIIGAFFGPFGMVMVVDYFIKRFHVNLADIYDTSRKTAYWYWKGINPYPIVAMLIGTVFSFWIYNPLTSVVNHPGIFRIAGAAIPASILASVLYYIMARIALIPKRIGMPESPRPRRATAAAAPAFRSEQAASGIVTDQVAD